MPNAEEQLGLLLEVYPGEMEDTPEIQDGLKGMSDCHYCLVQRVKASRIHDSRVKIADIQAKKADCYKLLVELGNLRAADIVALRVSPLHTHGTPKPDKEEKEEDWRMTLAERKDKSKDKKRVERRKAQESKQQKESRMHQDIMGILRQHTEMLWTLVHLQVQESHAHFPLQHIHNSMSGPPYTPSTFHIASGATALPLPLHPRGH
ncbi:uncharacterized protein LOC135981174 [Chrysemys picta bellii]|uniref:uncharacterized protein LOC135981174 n=1 Tax=Chrysemys picta bellii TaxID=8478 RepID=UPI0032B217AB